MCRLAALACLCLPAALAAPAAAFPARSLTLGFSNDSHLTGGTGADRAPWIRRAVAAGASIVRVNLAWSQVAPRRRPSGFDPADPGSPGYDWSSYDDVVRDLTSHGLQVMFTIAQAPTWAEGPRRPRNAVAGSWRPDPSQFGQFAHAAALRYDGSFPDPQQPGSYLPRVHFWEAWNEPNLDTYLAPQWVRSAGRWLAVAPAIYREMVNAFYAAVKSVSPANLVIIGSTAPYGEPLGVTVLGQERTQPVAFYRDLFCLQGAASLRPSRCPAAPHFDAIDHHPYGIRGPTWHALNPDDAAIPDLYKIARVLRAAVRAGHALPRGSKALWVAEFGWSSRPPNPHGIPVAEDARWYEQAFYILWRQGVSTILPLEIGDPAGVTNYSAQFESGLYYSDGRPKPIAQAYRFPFVAQRSRPGEVKVWGRAPQGGRLAVQLQRGRRWVTVALLKVASQQVFQATIGLHGRGTLRGRVGFQSSLTWAAGG